MIACAESCTGGMVAAALTELPDHRQSLTGVLSPILMPPNRLAGRQRRDAGRPRCGIGASRVRDGAAVRWARSGAQIAVSITGIAGPGGSEHKPEGRVCFGLASAAGITTHTQEFGALGRDSVRLAARNYALKLVFAGDCITPII